VPVVSTRDARRIVDPTEVSGYEHGGGPTDRPSCTSMRGAVVGSGTGCIARHVRNVRGRRMLRPERPL
jgi:hypothetical protein